MKRLFLPFIFFGAVVGFWQSNTISIKAEPYNTSGEKVIVYTTADNILQAFANGYRDL